MLTQERRTSVLSTDGSSRPKVALTMGDANGIGPEVILKCLSDERLHQRVQPVVVGSAHVMQIHAHALGFDSLRIHVVNRLPESLPENGVTVLDIAQGELPEVRLGKITADAGRLAMQAVERATDLCLNGQVDAMVTAPISKEAISLAGHTNTPGHTEFIARRTQTKQYTMMMVAESMRVGLVTAHVSIWDVPKRIKQAAILDKIQNIHEALQADFGIARPRIAVLGLNPHAGDGGLMGREEETDIIPAIRQACDEGYLTFGPFPADGFFAIGGHRAYDAVLAMYHDQGLVPFKMLAFEDGVNYTAGLPIVRTSPDHGTAFDIAGQGTASPGSMRHAIYLAVDVVRRRRAHQQRKAG